MIRERTEGDLVIITGDDDADRPEIEARVKVALAHLQRVNVLRRIGPTTHLIAAMTPTRTGIHVRGPSGRGVERTPRDAVWRGLSRFLAGTMAAPDDSRQRPP